MPRDTTLDFDGLTEISPLNWNVAQRAVMRRRAVELEAALVPRKEIADRLGVSISTLTTWLGSPLLSPARVKLVGDIIAMQLDGHSRVSIAARFNLTLGELKSCLNNVPNDPRKLIAFKMDCEGVSRTEICRRLDVCPRKLVQWMGRAEDDNELKRTWRWLGTLPKDPRIERAIQMNRDGLPYLKIAEQLQVDPRSLLKWIGQTNNNAARLTKRETAVELYRAGKTREEIVGLLAVNFQSLSNWLGAPTINERHKRPERQRIRKYKRHMQKPLDRNSERIAA